MICGLAVVGMDGCGHAFVHLAVFSRLNMIPKEVIFSVGTRVVFGLKAGIFPNPGVGCAGPTRESAENYSRVVLARPTDDPFLAGHALTRPA